MILKAVTLFLIVMVLLGMFGALRLEWLRPGSSRRRVRRTGAGKPARCDRCGRPLIGRGDCACKKEKGRG